MNIFVLDSSPHRAANSLCDRHAPKMTLETAQLLCSAFEPGKAPYRRTHYNHPCSIWTRTTMGNYIWLIEHGKAIGNTFFERFKKHHKSVQVIEWCSDNIKKIKFLSDSREMTEHPQCMPDCYKVQNDPVQGYRNYYIGDKIRFAKWEKGQHPPTWWPRKQIIPKDGELYKTLTALVTNNKIINFNEVLFYCGEENAFAYRFLHNGELVYLEKNRAHTTFLKKIDE